MATRLHTTGDDDRTRTQEPAVAEPSTQPAPSALRPGGLTSAEVLHLQRTAGNQAVGGMLAGLVPGAEPQEEEPEVIGGQPLARTAEEQLGDVARPIATGVGNLIGGVAGALTGVSISTSDVAGPTWNPHGSFTWDVGFSTTGASGWIVQEVINTYRADAAAGPAPGPRPTPNYWEAWAVDAASTVSPSRGAINDMWRRPSKGAGTQGHWSMRGKCYFTTTDPATQGFAAGNVRDAGILLSSTTEPPGLGIARLHRFAQGTWDSTGATPTHTGSAGP